MSDTFALRGSWDVTPNLSGMSGSGCPSIVTPISESVITDNKQLVDVDLGVDTPVVVDFGGVTNAHVVTVYTNRKTRVRLTSSDGATQSVPVDGLLHLISRSAPITALDLTRTPATETKVKVFLGERA